MVPGQSPKLQVDFAVNAKEMHMRDCAENSLESATKCGKVDAGLGEASQLSLRGISLDRCAFSGGE
jgi:hypothetical protein